MFICVIYWCIVSRLQKINIKDEEGWFENIFICAWISSSTNSAETIFERHIDWVKLIKNDDNFKNILQVKIQKEFKVTPHYIELNVTVKKVIIWVFSYV